MALAPRLPGTPTAIQSPPWAVGRLLYIMVDGAQSNVATLPIPVGLNITNVGGSIDGLYPASGDTPISGPVTFSEMLIATTFQTAFDILPDAKPFSVIARSGAGSAVIDIDPVNHTWKASLTVPYASTRVGDFSNSGVIVTDFLTGRPFPGNIIPLSRMDPIEVKAVGLLPAPNTESAARSVNTVYAASGDLSADGHFAIDNTTLMELSNFGGFTQIASQHGLSLTANFQLFIDGLLIASKDVSFLVQ
jgi:hypothetical protein